MDQATQHHACCGGQPCRPATGKRIRQDEYHIHAREDDDTEEKGEEEPEVFAVTHVSCRAIPFLKIRRLPLFFRPAAGAISQCN
ncbi:hypothetical protein D3C73_642830 [compost metagenome]